MKSARTKSIILDVDMVMTDVMFDKHNEYSSMQTVDQHLSLSASDMQIIEGSGGLYTEEVFEFFDGLNYSKAFFASDSTVLQQYLVNYITKNDIEHINVISQMTPNMNYHAKYLFVKKWLSTHQLECETSVSFVELTEKKIDYFDKYYGKIFEPKLIVDDNPFHCKDFHRKYRSEVLIPERIVWKGLFEREKIEFKTY